MREGLRFATLESDHFRIYYRGSDPVARERLKELLRFETEVYGNLFSKAISRPIEVTLFANRGEYARTMKIPEGRFAHYDIDHQIIYTTIDAGSGPLFHETIHAWTRINNSGLLRLWFEEGLASLYESPIARTDGGSLRFQFDRPNWRQRSMAKAWTPLAVFVNRADLPEPHSKGQARVIFIYLMRHGVLSAFVRAYFANLDFDFGGAKALSDATGKDLGALDRELMNFSKSLTRECNLDARKRICDVGLDVR